MRKNLLALIALSILLTGAVVTTSYANEAPVPPKQDWSFKKFPPKWDVKEIFRGYQVATQVCLSCHSFKYISHRDMMKLGFSEEQATKLADDMGMKLNDKLISALSPEAAQSTFGKQPPDLSVMALARHHGVDYIDALLTGYGEAPKDFHVPEGKHFNHYFPGHVVAMPPPLTTDGQVTYVDGTKATVPQMAHDVAAFIAWTSQPEKITREHLGVYVLLYLLIFATLSFLLMKHIWADVKKKK